MSLIGSRCNLRLMTAVIAAIIVPLAGCSSHSSDSSNSGAKNSAIKLMAASLLTDEPLRLTNMPRLADTRFMGKLLQRLGTEIVESDGEDGPETLLRTREIVSVQALPSQDGEQDLIDVRGFFERHGVGDGPQLVGLFDELVEQRPCVFVVVQHANVLLSALGGDDLWDSVGD